MKIPALLPRRATHPPLPPAGISFTHPIAHANLTRPLPSATLLATTTLLVESVDDSDDEEIYKDDVSTWGT